MSPADGLDLRNEARIVHRELLHRLWLRQVLGGGHSYRPRLKARPVRDQTALPLRLPAPVQGLYLRRDVPR